MDIFAYWFGQATLVHVIVACASLSASTGMVYGPWGTGHTIAVVAGVGWVVASVGMVTVMVVAVNEQVHKNNSKEIDPMTDFTFCIILVQYIINQMFRKLLYIVFRSLLKMLFLNMTG